jgi:tryptophan synthase alpha chain
MNKVSDVFKDNHKVLNIYITAGYPQLDSTTSLIAKLDKAGVDLIEVGMPYSDPLADGPTIQHSSEVALSNGMNLLILFDQLSSLKGSIKCPLILMGYYNQMLQYGVAEFLKSAAEAGVGALIIPDLPMDEYEAQYVKLFEQYSMQISFLITPFTSDERLERASRLSNAFLYIVSQTSITGNNSIMNESQINYFKRIQQMQLECNSLIGFGIHDENTFDIACQYSQGAIIGSAFIKALANESEECAVEKFANFKK